MVAATAWSGVASAWRAALRAAAGASGPWKSTIGSSRITLLPSLTTSDFAVTVYADSPVVGDERAVAGLAWREQSSLAPSRTRTPRYSNSPPGVLQIATREVSVLPKHDRRIGASCSAPWS